MIFDLLVVLGLVLVNGLFAGAEMATVTLRKTRIQQLLEEGKRSAAAVAQLRGNPERFLATVQVGITVVGFAAAAYGGDKLEERIAPLLEPTPLAPWAESIAFVLVVGAVSYLSLVLGELVPKSLALRSSERYALLVARPLVALSTVMRPAVWVLTMSSNAVLRLFGDRTSFTESRVSPDELKAMLEEAGEAGAVPARVGEIASRALDLSTLVASDVMVPRGRIVGIEKGASLDELRALVAASGHSRLPVYEGSLDNVVGIVRLRDVFPRGHEATIDAMVRPAPFVPESMRAIDVLHTLHGRAAKVAVVVDEHGGTAGLVSREDIADELFGAISAGTAQDESQGMHREDAGVVVLAGTALVREVNRSLEVALPEGDDWSTVGGMVVGLLGRMPGKGDRLELKSGAVVEVLDASPRRVRSVRVVPPPDREA